MKRIISLSLWLAAAAAHAQLEALRTLQPDQGQEVRRPIEAKVFNATGEELPAIEMELLALFKDSSTTLEGKQYTCRMLRHCASEACVPVLAPKLTDKDLSAFVRLVFQGLESPAADKALIDALSKAGNTEIKVGLIGTLGQRGSSASVKAIKPYLTSSRSELQMGAITALGNIGGKEAAKALVQAKVKSELASAWIHAQLKCAGTLDAKNAESVYRKFFQESYDEQIRAAALVGLVALSPDRAADAVLTTLFSDNACLKQTATGLLDRMPTDKLTGRLLQLEPDLQIRVLGILSQRKAADAENAVLQLAAGDNTVVRNAAYNTLAQIGGVHSVGMLISKAPQDDAAFEALCAMQAQSTDMALIQQFKQADDDKVKGRLLECLSQRKTAEALPLFIELAKGDWGRSCKAAIDGMATLIAETDFQIYADLLKTSKDKKKILAIENSIASAAQRQVDKEACAKPLAAAYPKAEGEAQYAIIRALGSIGGETAREILMKGLTSTESETKDAAVRGLCNWPNTNVADQLIDLATNSDNEKYQVLALRGYIRLANGFDEEKDAMPMCREVVTITDRPDVLKSVIACAKRFRSVDTIAFLTPMLDNPAIANEAGWALIEVSHGWRTQSASLGALEKTHECATDEGLKKATQARINEIKAAQ